MCKMTGCACNAGSRAGQGMSYQFSKPFSPRDTPHQEEGQSPPKHAPPRGGGHTTKACLAGPTQPEQPEPTVNGRHGPTHPTAGQADHWAAKTMANQHNQSSIVLVRTQQPHTRTCHKQTSHDKIHPTKDKRRRGRPTATKRGHMSNSTTPDKLTAGSYNDGEPTHRAGHTPLATQ